ncbi:MAG TPA: NADH-quinone oxidoreductase subunit N [Bacteroidales bacterium]|nr:NADH-quinone oxidoreductase subunit N [Bacteroidales bacterium]HQQ11647.1 NADH-quinone oxidoreductase subunit N [Bacteroidales bacterium]
MTDISKFTGELLQSMDHFMPETALIVTFLVALAVDLIRKEGRHLSGYVALAGFVITGLLLFQQAGIEEITFSGLLVIDQFSLFIRMIVLITAILVLLFSFQSRELHEQYTKLGEYYILIIGMVFGMFLLAGASNLIFIYLAIETMSISSYILSGYTKFAKRASEASMKYVIYGAVSSGIMVYGISIIFGLTGSLNLSAINAMMQQNQVETIPMLLAGLMILTGFGYKISAVPFHFWTPDVYEGAPITITALLSVASKAAGFAVMLRFFRMGLSTGAGSWELISSVDWHFVIAALAVLTMTLGNLVALWQNNMKRMLAYSSIAHAGYMLMAVAVLNDTGVAAILIYFFMYMIMNLGAFLVVQVVADKSGSEDIETFSGLGYRSPLLGVVMTIFLISLTGLPPTAGFIGKLYVFTSVMNAGYVWLAIVGVLNSVVSLYYYVRVIRNMYLRDVESQREKITFNKTIIVLLLVLAVPTLIFGVYFGPIVDWANASMIALMR